MSKWQYSAGERPNTVTVYEREPGGPLYARAWRDGKRFRVSLGHRDRARARKYAREQSAKLEQGKAGSPVTLAQVFRLYVKHQSPKKAPAHARDDVRRSELWSRILGGNSDPHAVALSQWDAFIRDRASGAIDAKGHPVPEVEKRRTVRARGVEIDCVWLKAVFKWATEWRMPDGTFLMRENPVRGFRAPREKNPRRPLATQDRFEAIRAVSDKHTMQWRVGTKWNKERSYLSELLDIVNGTGRRISAVCSLRYEDLRLTQSATVPHGAICWPADTEKTKRETLVPISPEVRRAVDRVLRERPGLGRAPLFPSPADPSKPMTRHLADKWLREGEKLAGVEPLKGKLWHAYRGKWATERKHLPDADVAAAGGWKDPNTLRIYQQADDATMLSVVLGGGELREAK